MAKQTHGEGQNSSQGSCSKQGNSLDKSEIPYRFRLCKNPLCKFWHPPVCLNYKSEKGCVHGEKCHFRHVERRKAQQEVEDRWCKRISCSFEGVYTNWVVYLKIFLRKSILREPGKLESKHTVKFSTPKKNLGKDRVHREVLSKSVRLMSVVLARQNSRKYHMRRP